MQILSTKLIIPPLRSKLVPRNRLIQKLNQGSECGFILVSAPAGYGKSTLLSAWLFQLEIPSVWLSLDENDNDPYRFLSYLVAACQQVDPKISVKIDGAAAISLKPGIENILTVLINELAGLSEPLCLVLDDYHSIQDQSVHQVVAFLLEHRPATLRLVISTRADPPLPLSKLRAKGEMTELRMADMRFSANEAAEFLKHTMGLQVSPEDANRITQRTEGWIAGLQMAALSMQNMADFSSFISAFTGSHHYIFDYLLEEILGQQTPELQRFLLSTSILEQMCAPLCDAVLEYKNLPGESISTGLLEKLDHSNLFIIPLDHDQRWYRYHSLFAELLRGYLQKKDPAQIPILHTLASSWYEQQGMISDAIRHAFFISDWERSVRLISGNIFALLEQNELTSVARQIEHLTGENTAARPWLLIAHAWLLAYTGQLNEVEPILKLAETEIDSLKSETELQTLGGHIAAIRAYIYWIGDNREIAAKSAQVALEWLPETDRLIRCQAATLLGLNLPDFTDRTRAMESALAYARDCPVSHVTIFAHGCWAWLLTMQGRLRDAYAACQEAVQLAQSSGFYASLPTLSHVYTTMSGVLLEWNDVEEALHYSKQAVDLARRWEQADALHFALNNYGYALFASGDLEQAFAISRQARQVAKRTSTWFEQISLSQEIEWYLSLNNLEAALQCVHNANLEIEDPLSINVDSFQSVVLPFTFVQIYLAQKQYTKALKFITVLSAEMEKRKIGYYQIRLLLWQVLAYEGLKQEGLTLDTLKQLLLQAAPEGYLHIFLIAGAKMLPLLYKARREGITPEYTSTLIEAIESRYPQKAAGAMPVPGLVEPISARELEVLRLLAQGCSDKLIATTLVIAPETVHKHLKNIYGKLDVHNRTEAVRRSNELGIL